MQKGKPNKEKRSIIEQYDIFRISSRLHFHTHTDINNFTSFDLLYLDIHPRHFYLNILSERMNNYLFIFVLLHLFKY